MLLVDDRLLMCQGLRTLLEMEEGMEIVVEAVDGVTAVQAFEELSLDIVRMDICTRWTAWRRPVVSVEGRRTPRF